MRKGSSRFHHNSVEDTTLLLIYVFCLCSCITSCSCLWSGYETIIRLKALTCEVLCSHCIKMLWLQDGWHRAALQWQCLGILHSRYWQNVGINPKRIIYGVPIIKTGFASHHFMPSFKPWPIRSAEKMDDNHKNQSVF